MTRQLTRGDEMAYREFYNAYFDRLSRYLLVVTAGNEDAMRDALQESFTRVVRYIRVFSTEAAFWSWLTVLARSALADAHRRRRRYFAFLDRFTRYTEIEHPLDSEDRTDDRLPVLLEQNLRLLPIEERQLLEWKYFELRPVRDIAECLQTTEKAVESRLVRVRRKLKQAMLAELNHEPS